MDDDFEPSVERARARRGDYGWLLWLGLFLAFAVGAVLFWRMRGDLPEIVAEVLTPDAGLAIADAGTLEVDAGQPAIGSKAPADGDTLLRKLATSGSKSPDLATWLSAPDIVQRIAAASRLVSEGKSPRPVLMFIEIPGEFTVQEKGTQIFIAPESYSRYDTLLNALTSIDPAHAARTYADVRPYFDSAFAQVARPGERFDDVLAAAVLRLSSVKLPEGPIEVVEKGAIYAFADPALESLTPAEKHVLRMGPRNVEALQGWLRSFSGAVGLRLAK